MTDDRKDITIVGGGMVGAALAALLAVANPRWRLALVESFPLRAGGTPVAYQPSFDDRSTAVAHGSVGLLQQAGVWELLQQHATPIRQVHVSDRGHPGGALIDSKKLGVSALGYVIPNIWIGRVLLSRLQQLSSLELFAPASVTRLQPQVDGMSLDIQRDADEVSIHTRLAVIADGANSALCRSLGIETRVDDYRQTAIIANIACEKAHEGIAYERFTDEGPLAMLPLGGGDGHEAALVWTQPTDAAEQLITLHDDMFLQRLQQRFGYRLGQLLQVGKRDSYRLSLSLASEQVRSSLVVMGNAAHYLHPVAGQGFNLALRDCAALAVCLQRAGDQSPGSLQVLQDYLRQQQLDQQATIAFSDQVTRLFSNSQLPLAVLRGLGFLGLECLSPARNLLVRQTMGSAGRQVILQS